MGDLTGYTDHRRYAFGAYAALERGWRVYREPLVSSTAGVDFPFPIYEWPNVPVPHPPGVLAFFLPPALLGKWVPMSEQTFGRLLVGWVLLWTHVAMALVFAALRAQPPGARLVVASVAWLVLVLPALHGFPDAMWLGFGALMIRELTLRRPERALWSFVPAMLLSYRSVVLVPLALSALYDALRGRPPRRWPWPLLLSLAVSSAVVVVLFGWLSTFAMDRTEPPLALQLGEVRLWVTLGLAAAGVWLGRRANDAVLAFTALGICALALVDAAHWWHAVAVLPLPIALGARTAPARLAWLRAGAAVWALAIARAGFHSMPFYLVKSITRFVDGRGE